MDVEVLARAPTECEPRIRAFFRRRCTDPRDVEDLVQECMGAALSSFHRFRGDSAIETWLYAICRNLVRSRAYYARRDRLLLETIGRSLPPDAGNREDLLDLSLLLENLSPAERRLYDLRYVEGRTILEISAVLGRPSGTVKYLLHRLRSHVRGLLQAPSSPC